MFNAKLLTMLGIAMAALTAVGLLAYGAVGPLMDAPPCHLDEAGAAGGGADAAFFSDLLKVYTPRRACMYYEAPVIWLHFVSDLLIAAAYYSIPLALVYFVRRRRDLAFNWIFWMFAAFILACGTTHIFSVWDLWQPLYKVDGIVRAVTAAVSVTTAVLLWPLIPRALALPSPIQLEEQVRLRTAELGSANEALRNSEQRKQAILESTLDCIITMDERGAIVDFNPAAERTFGYKREDVVGRPVADVLIPARLRDAHRAGLARFLRTGEATVIGTRVEMPAVRADGAEFPVELAITAAKAPGNASFFTAYVRDISQRKQAEAERIALLESERAARSDAEHANRMKDEFLATLSHELRTPLGAILGWAQMIQRDKIEPDELQQGISTIERNARAQTKLIEDLLDMNRIISGKIRLDVQRVDLPAVVQAAIGAAQPAAQGKSIRIRHVLDPRADVVMGDPNRLQQVLWNLLSNAVKFTPKGGNIDIVLERVNSHVELSVADTGKGIPADFLPYVFDRFRQQDSSTTREHRGLGLGLSIVKSLVELHGGRVRAESAGEGRGATFVVELPVVAIQTASEAVERRHPLGDAPKVQSTGDTAVLAGLRILVVDDEPDGRDVVRRILAMAAASVRTVATAAEGLAALRTDRYDLILSDIGMPGMDGYEFIRAVRALPSGQGGETPAIALTAFARSEDRTRALRAGYQGHMAKPVHADELLATVQSMARRSR